MVTRERTPLFYGPTAGSVRELATIAAYLDGRAKTDNYTKLAALFADDFPAFMAIFQGQVWEVPTRLYLERVAFYCRVWLFVQDAGEDGIEDAASSFHLPEEKVRAICSRVTMHLNRRKVRSQKES